jgi:hypothetical protein
VGGLRCEWQPELASYLRSGFEGLPSIPGFTNQRLDIGAVDAVRLPRRVDLELDCRTVSSKGLMRASKHHYLGTFDIDFDEAGAQSPGGNKIIDRDAGLVAVGRVRLARMSSAPDAVGMARGHRRTSPTALATVDRWTPVKCLPRSGSVAGRAGAAVMSGSNENK